MTSSAGGAAQEDVLQAALPRRWGRWQRAKNTALYLAARGVAGTLRRLPVERGSWVAGPLGRLGWALSPAHRRRALENLAVAFPERSATERRRLGRACFVHLARTALETVRQEALLARRDGPRLTQEHRALLAEALAEGKGAVLVSGHLGNWELIPSVISRAGFPVTVVGTPLYDPRLTRWVHELRSREGIEVLWRGGKGMRRGLLGVFKRGRILGLLIDQDTDVKGAFVPFFGRPAHTPTAGAALALHVGAPILAIWARREGGEHRVVVERLEPPGAGDHDERVRALTAATTARLEEAIRAAPEQWVWMHRRWKRKQAPQATGSEEVSPSTHAPRGGPPARPAPPGR